MRVKLKKHRSQANFIYGRNPIEDALKDGRHFERIYIKDSLHGDLEKYIRQVCRERDIPLKRVPLVKLDQLARMKAHQGVVGITSLVNYQEISEVIPFSYV